MSNEIQIGYGISSRNTYASIYNSIGKIFNTDIEDFETYNASNIADYNIVLTELGNSAVYAGDMPSSITSGIYSIVARDMSGISPDESDIIIGVGSINWDGSTVLSLNDVTLADNSITDNKFNIPTITGVATGPVGMIIQLWRRFYKKVVKNDNDGTLKTYADDGSAIITTQNISSVGGTETLGGAT